MFSSMFRQEQRPGGGPATFTFSPRSSDLASSPSPLTPKRTRIRDPEVISPTQMSPEDDREYIDGDEDDENTHADDEVEAQTPLLPVFSATRLDALPVYQLTHDIRVLIAARCETTLTWEQLRSPQVSQFLLKPIQKAIRDDHFSKATLYALIVNCFQFGKEGNFKPGISGASRTRAMVSELLAIKLLKEYSTRDLIDALSYDFYPLQGQAPPSSQSTLRGPWDNGQRKHGHLKDVRISCLEIAIRAQAKRFLAHPLVVQQLEAIWAGTVVFRSAADSLHRQPAWNIQGRTPGYGSINPNGDRFNPKKPGGVNAALFRRSVSLYNPRDASLFKLSRLRVPRYRQFLSTLSFAILLGLFLTMLQQRPLELTVLEVIFWFWSAGFMLDEIVGFNEQGFSLYLMSFWNTFDLGILVLFVCYYLLRIYSAFLPAPRRHEVANQAYDVLAANAVLLLPRLFSVLDHYRYFSQLLIAFRMMAADLIAVLTLIIIACSGFFVAFTFSFGSNDSPSAIAYALFQMLMGFTPAGWALWDHYNPLGKAILVLFLFICHFLVVTILITVLTNSFMAIAQNAHEEHQFVFAVNAISMVKSDDLFAYVAPANVLAWAITPLRYILPFRSFIEINRTVIKVTHLPILFSIYLYERAVLRSAVVEPTDLVEQRPNPIKTWIEQHDIFTPKNAHRVREPSVATHQKDEALEQVFRRPGRDSTYRRTFQNQVRRQSSTAVNNWMQNIGAESAIIPPEVDDIVEELETRRRIGHRSQRRRRHRASSLRDFTETTRSFASDPEEFISHAAPRRDHLRLGRSFVPARSLHPSLQTDVEGDDELSSGENAEDDKSTAEDDSPTASNHFQGETLTSELDGVPIGPQPRSSRPSTAKLISRRNSPTRVPRTPQRHHFRNPSTGTILYNPLQPDGSEKSYDGKHRPSPKGSRIKSGSSTPHRRRPDSSPKGQHGAATRPRPILPPPSEALSLPDQRGFMPMPNGSNQRRPYSSFAMGLGSDLGDNKAVGGGFVGGVPASFATQMAYAMGGIHNPSATNDNRDMMSRLVLARMKTLEEGFREVVKEVKDLRNNGERRIRPRPAVLRRLDSKTKTKTRGRSSHQSRELSHDGSGSVVGDNDVGDGDNIPGPLLHEDEDTSSDFKASSV